MRTVLSICGALAAWGCGAMAVAADHYLVQPGDLLTVSVWKEAELSGDLLVRPDGAITEPLAGEIEAAGHNVEEIRAVIVQRLREYVPDAVVTVNVKQTLGYQIFIIGKVNKPGQYLINRPVDVVQALSLAGGMTPFASVENIRVLRRRGEQQTEIPFRYNDIEHGRQLQQNILLQSGDTVVVP